MKAFIKLDRTVTYIEDIFKEHGIELIVQFLKLNTYRLGINYNFHQRYDILFCICGSRVPVFIPEIFTPDGLEEALRNFVEAFDGRELMLSDIHVKFPTNLDCVFNETIANVKKLIDIRS